MSAGTDDEMGAGTDERKDRALARNRLVRLVLLVVLVGGWAFLFRDSVSGTSIELSLENQEASLRKAEIELVLHDHSTGERQLLKYAEFFFSADSPHPPVISVRQRGLKKGEFYQVNVALKHEVKLLPSMPESQLLQSASFGFTWDGTSPVRLTPGAAPSIPEL